jgi:hypothetical protein
MDSIRAAGQQVQAGRTEAPKPKVDATPQAPKDSVDTGAKPDEAGLVHKAFRGLAKVVGGATGSVFGAMKGGIKGAASEEPHQMVKPGEMKFLRAHGAAAGALLGGVAGALSFGPVGFIVGVVAGPVLGSALSGGIPGAMDGAWAATKGTVKGAWGGMKEGAKNGGKLVDWVASKFEGHHTQPPAPEPPKPDKP